MKQTSEIFAFDICSSIKNQNFVSHKAKYAQHKMILYYIFCKSWNAERLNNAIVTMGV